MKNNNPNFFTNFTEEKMTESVKLADYRGTQQQEAHHQQFEKYAAEDGNQDQTEQVEEREEKIIANEGI